MFISDDSDQYYWGGLLVDCSDILKKYLSEREVQRDYWNLGVIVSQGGPN